MTDPLRLATKVIIAIVVLAIVHGLVYSHGPLVGIASVVILFIIAIPLGLGALIGLGVRAGKGKK